MILPGGEATTIREMVKEPGLRGPVRCLLKDVEDLREEEEGLQAKEGQSRRHQEEGATKEAGHPQHQNCPKEQEEGRSTTRGDRDGDRRPSPHFRRFY